MENCEKKLRNKLLEFLVPAAGGRKVTEESAVETIADPICSDC